MKPISAGLRTLLGAVAFSLCCLLAPAASAQPHPYIGFVYPAGGRQGTTFQIRLGGQALDGVHDVLVTGSGISARLVEYRRPLNFQDMRLLNEELRLLRNQTLSAAAQASVRSQDGGSTNTTASSNPAPTEESREAARKMIDKVERRTSEFVPNPASASLAAIVIAEVTILSDAPPGERQIRLVTASGVSNPMTFMVGQLPEYSRDPMLTSRKEILGKESQALRHRLPSEIEQRVTLPCTANGQIASGEANRYRFAARAGQHLVFTTLARHLVPFLADAVPGWFQPVLELYDAAGKEVAYDDDYRFDPDPTLFYTVPKDGEYILAIHDSIYRGREDFVYRLTLGEVPFLTGIFPLGGRSGSLPEPKPSGCNLKDAHLLALPSDSAPGIHTVAVEHNGLLSNPLPFAVDTLPELLEHEPNNDPVTAQDVTLPVIVNGRIAPAGDWDVFRFLGQSNSLVVVDVQARCLGSPLDSFVKLTGPDGKVLAFNDDHPDLTAGLNTDLADSYLMARLPSDGAYCVHIGDTARHGGPEYAYRMRISAPQPDFALRVEPSSLSLRSRSSAPLTVYAVRKDGFTGPIKVTLQDPPSGFLAAPLTLPANRNIGRLTIRTRLSTTPEPVSLSVVGSAEIQGRPLVHAAIATDDRMQAFLWRHLVPADDLKVLVFNPASLVSPARNLRIRPPTLASTNAPSSTTPKFTKPQIAFQLRQLNLLFDEGLLTDEFYRAKLAECEAPQ